MRRYIGKCNIFFGIERGLRKEELEEQFNRKAKEGWRFAADAARITDERAGREDRQHTSGGVFCCSRQATWEQWLDQKKEQSFRSQQRRKNRCDLRGDATVFKHKNNKNTWLICGIGPVRNNISATVRDCGAK